FERPTWWSAASRRNGAAPKCCLASARRKNASSSSLLYCGGPAPAGGVFVSASSSRSSWRTTLRPASDYSRRTSASLTCRRERRPPHEPDHFLQTEWDLTGLPYWKIIFLEKAQHLWGLVLVIHEETGQLDPQL